MSRKVAICQRVALLLLVVGTFCNSDDTCKSKTHESHQDDSGEDVNEFFQNKVKVEIKDISAELQSKFEAQETRLQAAEQDLRESKQQIQDSNARIAKLEAMVLGLLGKESQPDSGTDMQLDELQEISKVEPSAPGDLSVSHLNASVTRINITAANSAKLEDCRSLLSKRSGKTLILKEISDWVNKQIDKAKDGLKKIISKGLKGLTKIINTVKDAAKSALDAIKPSNLWTAIKPFVTQVTDPVTNVMKKAFNSVKKFALAGINFFQGLYDKYLKPIINHIGRCASKGNVPNFIFCMIEPVVNQIFKYLMPAGDIAKEVPFADEKVENIWDFDMGRYVQTKKCRDCNGDDPRDRSPSACREEEQEVGIGTMILKVCDAPFGMDEEKDIDEEIMQSLWDCNKKASVFQDGTVWATIFDTLESARPSLFTAETITSQGLDKARHLKTLMTSNPQMSQAEALITQFKQTMEAASDNCMKAKDASTVLMAHLIRVLEKFNLVAGQWTKTMGLAESCQEDLLIGCNLLSQMEHSADTAVQGVSADLKSSFTQTEQTLKAMIVLLNQAADSISGDMQDSLEERMRTVATPTFADLKNLPRNCAIGKGPYMKMYTSFKGNNPITGMGELFRMSLHQRTGFKIAWRDFKNLKKGFVIKSVSYDWEQLREATKQSDDIKVEFCFIFFCVHITFRLRNKLNDLLGIPMPSLIKNIDMGDETYFFTLEVSVFELTLEKIGIPVELQIPVDTFFPEMTLPFIVTIPEPTTPPALPSVVEKETELSEGAEAALTSMEEEQNIATQEKQGSLQVENLCAAEDGDRAQITQANGELSPDLTDNDFLVNWGYELLFSGKMCKGGKWFPNAYAYASGGGGTSPGTSINQEQAIATGIAYCAKAMADDSTCSKEWIAISGFNGHCRCQPADYFCNQGTITKSSTVWFQFKLTPEVPRYNLWSQGKLCKGGRWFPNTFAYASGGGGTSSGTSINKEQAIATGIDYCAKAIEADPSCSQEWVGIAGNNGHCWCLPENSFCDQGTVSNSHFQFKLNNPTAPSYNLLLQGKLCKGGRWFPNRYAWAQGGGGTSSGTSINKEQAIATGIDYCAKAIAADSTCSKEWIGIGGNNGHCWCLPEDSFCDQGTESTTSGYSHLQFKLNVPTAPSYQLRTQTQNWCKGGKWFPDAYAYAQGGGGTSSGTSINQAQAVATGIAYCAKAMEGDSACSQEWIGIASNNGHCWCLPVDSPCSGGLQTANHFQFQVAS